MAPGTAKRVILLSWLVAIIVVSADEIRRNKAAQASWPQVLPCPHRFVATTIAFTLWGILGEFAAAPAAALSAGTVVALFIKAVGAGDFPSARASNQPVFGITQ